LIGADFRGDQQKYSDMVVKVGEAAHTSDPVMHFPSDVYSDFLD
jgi:hypothetical protein